MQAAAAAVLPGPSPPLKLLKDPPVVVLQQGIHPHKLALLHLICNLQHINRQEQRSNSYTALQEQKPECKLPGSD